MKMICSVFGDKFQLSLKGLQSVKRGQKWKKRKSKNIMAAWASIYTMVLFSFDDVM